MSEVKRARLEENDDRELPEDEDKLETFRKGAIYREFRAAQRRQEETQTQLDTIQKQLNAADARVAAVTTAWNLVVSNTFGLFEDQVQSTSSGPIAFDILESGSLDDFDIDEWRHGLDSLSQSTIDMIVASKGRLETKFTSEQDASLVEKANEKLAAAIAAVHFAVKKEHRLTQQLEHTQAELNRAYRHQLRSQSKSVAELEGKDPQDIKPEIPKEESKNGAQPPSTDVPVTTPAVPAPETHTPTPTEAPSQNGVPSTENKVKELLLTVSGLNEEISQLKSHIIQLEQVVQTRTRQAEQYYAERGQAKLAADQMRSKLMQLPDDIVVDAPAYKIVYRDLELAIQDRDHARQAFESVQNELDSLREREQSYVTQIKQNARAEVDDLHKKIQMRDADMNRIRNQREDLRSELTEVKAGLAEFVKSKDQLKVLADQRHDRIDLYEKQVRRFSATVAALKGRPDSVDVILEEDEPVSKLLDQLKACRDVIDAHPDVDFLTQLKETLDNAHTSSSSTSQDSEALAAKLKASESAAEMLYTEIDRLSKAWADMDAQIASKTFSLHAYEEKTHKFAMEKTKADNKYFGAMRTKDQLTLESQALNKTVERQQRALDSSTNEARSLAAKIDSFQKTIAQLNAQLRHANDKLARHTKENADLATRAKHDAKALQDITAVLSSRTAQLDSEMAAHKKLQEHSNSLELDLTKERKTSERLQSQVNEALTQLGSGKPSTLSSHKVDSQIHDLKEYNADLLKLLNCSVCKTRVKEVIIDRCCHLFCRKCIDERLINRQRKCPTCAAAFGKDDVRTIYL